MERKKKRKQHNKSESNSRGRRMVVSLETTTSLHTVAGFLSLKDLLFGLCLVSSDVFNSLRGCDIYLQLKHFIYHGGRLVTPPLSDQRLKSIYLQLWETNYWKCSGIFFYSFQGFRLLEEIACLTFNAFIHEMVMSKSKQRQPQQQQPKDHTIFSNRRRAFSTFNLNWVKTVHVLGLEHNNNNNALTHRLQSLILFSPNIILLPSRIGGARGVGGGKHQFHFLRELTLINFWGNLDVSNLPAETLERFHVQYTPQLLHSNEGLQNPETFRSMQKLKFFHLEGMAFVGEVVDHLPRSLTDLKLHDVWSIRTPPPSTPTQQQQEKYLSSLLLLSDICPNLKSFSLTRFSDVPHIYQRLLRKEEEETVSIIVPEMIGGIGELKGLMSLVCKNITSRNTHWPELFFSSSSSSSFSSSPTTTSLTYLALECSSDLDFRTLSPLSRSSASSSSNDNNANRNNREQKEVEEEEPCRFFCPFSSSLQSLKVTTIPNGHSLGWISLCAEKLKILNICMWYNDTNLRLLESEVFPQLYNLEELTIHTTESFVLSNSSMTSLTLTTNFNRRLRLGDAPMVTLDNNCSNLRNLVYKGSSWDSEHLFIQKTFGWEEKEEEEEEEEKEKKEEEAIAKAKLFSHLKTCKFDRFNEYSYQAASRGGGGGEGTEDDEKSKKRVETAANFKLWFSKTFPHVTLQSPVFSKYLN